MKNEYMRAVDHLAKMLVRRDLMFSGIRAKYEEQINELDYVAKTLVRRDFEMHQAYEAMRALDEAIAKDDALLASIGMGIFAIDRKGKIILVNKQAELMLGWSVKDIMGKKGMGIIENIPLKDKDGNAVLLERQPIQLALSSGKVITNNTYYYVRKDKTKFPVSITASQVILGGKIDGAIMTFRDITKEKEIDRLKSEFVSVAAHQLRVPLTTIKWSADVLLDEIGEKINEQQKKYLENIRDVIRGMSDLVDVFLNVSKMELGTLSIDPEPTNLITLAYSVQEDLLQNIRSKELQIATDYDKNLAPINVDPRLIRIIFQNLLSNAVKYTPKGGSIRITIKKRESDVLFQVADTGYGIPSAQQHKIFKKLFRADNIIQKEPGGIGLGLYIVKWIVEKSGGAIWFESKEDKGTTFYVTIPLGGMVRTGEEKK